MADKARKPPELPNVIAVALREVKQALIDLYGIRLSQLYLYGSYARGTATPASDVDLLVVLNDDTNPATEIERLNPAVSEIRLRHDLLISTFPVSLAWFEHQRSPLFLNIRREGVPL